MIRVKKCVIMIEGVSKKIVNLTLEETNLVRTVKENSTVEAFNLIFHFVANKINKLSHENKKCHQIKYEIDHIRTLKYKCKNRNFRKSERKRYDREKKKGLVREEKSNYFYSQIEQS